MQSPKQILADLWTLAGGEPSALDTVALTGEEPQLPSSFLLPDEAKKNVVGDPTKAGDNSQPSIDLCKPVDE